MRALALAALIALTGAAPVPPAPTRWVEDQAGLMSRPARDALDRRLESYQRATGHQVVVWIGETLEGAPLDDWAVRTFEAWKVGRKGVDDGLVVFVLAKDRLIDIEVGYGLEGQVPDVVASRVINDVMAPRLRAGDADGAISTGVDALLAVIEGEPWTGATSTTTTTPPTWRPTWWQLFLGGLAVVAFLILFITNPSLALALLWSIGTSRGGGGFGGGGGFRGGGGRSGGGGARGSW